MAASLTFYRLDSNFPVLFPQVWRFISTQLLESSHPMELHQALLAATYQGWPVEELGPPPVSGLTAARPGTGMLQSWCITTTGCA